MIRTHVLAALLTTLALATVSTASAAPAKTGYARSGDLDLYYEIHGSGGMPLVVLQGSFRRPTSWATAPAPRWHSSSRSRIPSW